MEVFVSKVYVSHPISEPRSRFGRIYVYKPVSIWKESWIVVNKFHFLYRDGLCHYYATYPADLIIQILSLTVTQSKGTMSINPDNVNDRW